MLGSERYMTPHNVRFNTYDPAIDNILQQLKSCNKLAAFVRDSIIYYLGSKQGRQAADLMCRKKTTNRHASPARVGSAVNQGANSVLELSQSAPSLQSNVVDGPFTSSGTATHKSASIVTGTPHRTILEKLFDLKK
jgi:hypothetical protein